jgi:PmbA protein
MNKEMYDLVAWSIKTAKSAGADECRVRMSSRRFVDISYRERKPETIKEASTRSFDIVIFVNGRYSSQSTSDLRKSALKDFITNAIATTKFLEEDPYRTLPDPKYYKGRAKLDLGQLDPDYKKFSPEDRHNMVKAIEESCIAKGGKKVISVTAREIDEHGELFMMASNGFEGSEEYTLFQAGASMTAQGEGDRRPSGYHFVASVIRKNMPAPEKIGAEAATRTLYLI